MTVAEWAARLMPLIHEVLGAYALPSGGIHGVAHWARVRENGLRIVDSDGGDPEVVALFAVLHDARRRNEAFDPGHGRRGAKLAYRLRGRLLQLDDDRFKILSRACIHHTGGDTDSSPTVGACWDADRLDLGRVGIRPDSKYLSTRAARSPDLSRWAYARGVEGAVPAWAVEAWGLQVDSRTGLVR